MRWMGLFVLAYSLRQIGCHALIGRGMKVRKTAVEAGGLILMSILSVLLIPTHGVLGAAWMIIGAEAAMATTAWFLLQCCAPRNVGLRDSTASKM